MRKSSLRHVKREGRRGKVTLKQEGIVKTMDQESWGITSKRLYHWLKATWERRAYCRERKNVTLKVNQMRAITGNLMNLACRKILENVVKVWTDNLKTEGEVRWVEGLFKNERMITGNVKVKSVWNKVEETLGTIDQILGKVNNWSREWIKGHQT